MFELPQGSAFLGQPLDSCCPATVWGQGHAQRGSFLPRAQPPPGRVSVACAISNSKSPAKPVWVASLARDAARPMGSGYPKGLAVPRGAQSKAAGS